ncbi:MAG: hypothetical protein RMZ41_011870 [Nostoc sp. DedVER02]|uniref:hypothetical protein n=1 Tax=unclassified Nostoc TaxID=2593658 RepID=UPI002AD447F2|nr:MULTISPECIES: hypothetical protein [unclassified Nostoc]MDZ7989664.1 hypothetical protein [Nostoc sp. DedVER02]MDZ8113400.1 hypothetical protein [Nostoc sp. DedVER01b]
MTEPQSRSVHQWQQWEMGIYLEPATKAMFNLQPGSQSQRWLIEVLFLKSLNPYILLISSKMPMLDLGTTKK